MMRKALFAISALGLVLTPACAQEKIGTADKEAIEEIVRSYILENPEIIEEALITLSQKQQEAELAAQADLVASHIDEIYNNASDPFVGPIDAPITIVEFFDYRCGYCKRSAEWAMTLPEKYDGKVRVVFKEFPILSPESEKAALAAIAAQNQGLYAEMHLGLMQLDNSTGFTDQEIDRVAAEAGLDVAKMRADMKSIDVQRTVAQSKSLARNLNISSTPNFLIGEQVIAGANTPLVEAVIQDRLDELG